MARYPVVVGTMEEDFRAIGLLPPLEETDDPTKPRDIPSPDPDTLAGLDDSEGDDAAHMAGAKQPKPKMGPDADDAEKSGYDPDEDGGSEGAQKSRGKYEKVAGGKEASLESMQYQTAGKQPMSGKGKKQGEKTVIAKGLKPVKKLAGMVKEGRYSKVATLIEEVGGLLRSVQIDEEVDQLLHSFKLVAENATLLADRLTEISDAFEVEDVIDQMEALSRDAVEAIDIVETELEACDDDDEDAIAHSSDVNEGKYGSDRNPDETYDIPSPAFKECKENSEKILNVMVNKLMDALEGYDNALTEMDMGMGAMDEGDDDGDSEVHLHTKANRVHVHHGHDDDDGDDDDHGHEMAASGDDGDDGEGDGDEDMGDEGDHDDGDDGESDHDTHSLMAKMKALKGRREAMSGGRSFRGDEEDEDDGSY